MGLEVSFSGILLLLIFFFATAIRVLRKCQRGTMLLPATGVNVVALYANAWQLFRGR